MACSGIATEIRRIEQLTLDPRAVSKRSVDFLVVVYMLVVGVIDHADVINQVLADLIGEAQIDVAFQVTLVATLCELHITEPQTCIETAIVRVVQARLK